LRTLRQAFSLREAFEAVAQRLPELKLNHLTLSPELDKLGLTQLASLDAAGENALSFLSDRRYLKQAESSQAAALLLTPKLKNLLSKPSALLIAVNQPYAVFAGLSQWVAEKIEAERLSESRELHRAIGAIAPGVFVDPTALIGINVRLAPGVVVGAGSEIADGSVIEAHCVIGRDCKVGRDSRLYPHVVMYDDCQVGERAIVHSGTVIGADGFGFAQSEAAWIKIAQLGAVRIGNDVEIGSNCSIDRGTLGDTVIEDGCKLDNLIQIAHNVRVGERSVLAACVGIAGSAKIGRRCMIGGSVGILGHLSVADDVTITPMSLVMSTISQPGVYSGSSPLQAHRDWEKSAAIQRVLPDLRSRLRALEALNKNRPETL
jgi:UDP-3-O-[3-hydroxymyristoyl] glucosamine N-acyltransferase